MPKRWFSVGSLGIRKTRANLYFSGHVRYVSMSEALSSSPSPRARQERLERRLVAARRCAAARARASRSASSSSSSSGLVSRTSRCCGGRSPEQRGVDARQRVGDRLPVAAVQQRRELDQLEVAHDAVGDVEVGVEAQLAEAPGGARDVAQQLVAQLGERRVQRLVGAEELLVAVLPLAADAARASSANGDGGCSAPRSVRAA